VEDNLAFDVINGGPSLREWIGDAKQKPAQLEAALRRDERAWQKSAKKFYLYK
jgi:hypothetical protein